MEMNVSGLWVRNFRIGALAFLAVSGLSGVARGEVFPLPAANQHVIGSVTTVTSIAADTLVDIARRHGLGYNDLVRANPGVDPWLPGEGTEITLPTRFVLPDAPRTGVVLNLPEYRMYYYPPAKPGERAVVHTYPISIGRMDWETPLGATRVVAKSVRPSWYPPASIRQEHAEAGDPLPAVVPPGPDNPLGEFAMRLGLPGYLIHGTNRPAGVGMRVTHGCIRMFPEDIAVLFSMLPVNAPVRIVNQPIKFGWLDGELYMEAHEVLATATPARLERPDEPQPLDDDALQVADGEEIPAAAPAEPAGVLTMMTRAFVDATTSRTADADWPLMERVFADSRGIPVRVGAQRADDGEVLSVDAR